MDKPSKEGKLMLVLGAGASVPFGLPTASQLRNQLILKPPAMKLGDRYFCESTPEHKRRFSDAFAEAHGLSIDAFLERNAGFANYGKAAIAKIIGTAELQAIASKTIGADWMATFFPLFSDNPSALVDGTVRFITFNYDNLLETAILQWLRQQGKSAGLALEYQHSLPVLHVYGRLGGLFDTHQTEAARAAVLLEGKAEYLPDTCFAQWGQDIRLIGDERAADSDQVLQQCRNWVLQAHKIVFLGFGFDKLNMERIGAVGCAEASVARIYATGFGLERSERTRVARIFRGGVALGEDKVGCEVFLRRFCMDWMPDMLGG